jgi:Leucine-rich repeat (LRR) protein
MEKKKDMKFNNLIRTIILEQGRYEILKKTYTEPKGKGEEKKPAKMSVEMLDKLVLADPTTRQSDGVIKKAGEYTNWLIKQYLKLNPEAEYGTPQFKSELTKLRNQFFEDLYKVTDDLKKFDRHKGKLPQDLRDINKLDIDTLYDNVKDFTLEKEKATKEDRKEASKTFIFPGSDLIYDGPNWAVTKVSDTGQSGKDAACFFGGFNQETRWCTSAPGLSWFDRYIKDGPLYQVFKKGGDVAEKTGLPKERFQFHFPSNQYMDIHDRQIDLIKFLMENPELKELFKPEFAKGLTNQTGTAVSVEYPRDSASKYIALYGFDEFFENLPKNLERFDFTVSNNRYGNDIDTSNFALKLPDTIGRFTDLHSLHLDGVVSEIPDSIGNLKKLEFLSLPNNKNLKSVPASIANIPGLMVLNLKGSNPNVEIPEEVVKMSEENGQPYILK